MVLTILYISDPKLAFPKMEMNVDYMRKMVSLVKIGLKPGNRSTWESHKCSGTQ